MNAEDKGTARELWLVYGASLALTAGVVALGTVIGFVGANALGLVALIFLYLPIAALRRSGREPADYGLSLSGWPRALLAGGLITALTLVPFAIGFHIWETAFFDHELELSADNYRAWPEGMRVEPQVEEPGVYVWRYQRRIVVACAGDSVCEVSLLSDAELSHRGGPRPRVSDAGSTQPPRSLGLTGWDVALNPDGARLVFWTRGGDWLHVAARGADAPLALFVAGAEPDGDGVRVERSLSWLPLALLVQLLLIALPEEFFYRGYLQARMAEIDRPIMRRRLGVGPVYTTVPILVTSVAFALGHFVIGFDPLRLAVFFPALVFGWLRDRTGGLVACVVYHAACNLMVELAVVHYWPAV